MIRLKTIAIICTIISIGMQAQTYIIKGTVSTSTGAVRSASVTFIDNIDTLQKYSALTDSSGNYSIDILTSVKSENNTLPSNFELEQNYPNPFSTSTQIPYKLKTQTDVQVTIYDILGREIRKFSVGTMAAGTHNVLWDGRNNFGQTTAAGIYFYRLQAGGESIVKKMVLQSGSRNNYIPLAKIISLPSPEVDKSKNGFLQGVSYTVEIDNSANTSPLIIPQQFSNIILQGDTTINFTVVVQSQIAGTPVYLDSVQQYIRGFGAANIIPWRPDMTTAEVNTAFGNGPGQLGFTILRLRIPYDDNISEFSADVPSAKLAESLGAIVFASPWTPPPAMKTNDNIVGGELNDTSYASYAAHLKSFADYMASNGAPLYAVSLQNEPDANVTYESCSWDGTQFLNFCKNNAPSVGYRIMMPESQNFVHALSDPTLNDSVAAANVSIIAGHIYGGGLGPYPLAVSKGKEVWMTEHYVNQTDTSITGNLGVGLEINNCMNAGMNAYVWWYIVRFYGPINENGGITERGYVMSQFSKFIRPGYYKIKCDPTPQRNISVTSYRDSSSSKVVIVVINSGSSPVVQTFSIINGTMSSFTPYTTSAAKNCEQGSDAAVTNGSFTVSLEASSITTFVSNK